MYFHNESKSPQLDNEGYQSGQSQEGHLNSLLFSQSGTKQICVNKKMATGSSVTTVTVILRIGTFLPSLGGQETQKIHHGQCS